MSTNEAFSRVVIDRQLADQGWEVENPNAVRYEYQLPAIGRLILEDAETGEVVEVNTNQMGRRAAFAEKQATAQTELERVFRSAGIDAIKLQTDQPYSVALGRFFVVREKRRLRG